MKKIIKLATFLFVTCYLGTSCQNSDLQDIVIKKDDNQRIIFKSTVELFDTYNQLNRMSPQELKKWVESKNINSLLDAHSFADSTMEERPDAFKAIFNNDYEVQINDSIIWYNHGDLYFINYADNKKSIETNKKDTKDLTIIGSSKITEKDIVSQTKPNFRASVGFDHGESNRYTCEFLCEISPKAKFRYVDHLYAHRFNANGLYYSELFFIAKIDFKKKNGWNMAGEKRHVNVELAGTIRVRNYPVLRMSLNETRRDVANHQWFLIETFYGPTWPMDQTWDTAITGYVEQEVAGYPLTRWGHYAEY